MADCARRSGVRWDVYPSPAPGSLLLGQRQRQDLLHFRAAPKRAVKLPRGTTKSVGRLSQGLLSRLLGVLPVIIAFSAVKQVMHQVRCKNTGVVSLDSQDAALKQLIKLFYRSNIRNSSINLAPPCKSQYRPLMINHN